MCAWCTLCCKRQNKKSKVDSNTIIIYIENWSRNFKLEILWKCGWLVGQFKHTHKSTALTTFETRIFLLLSYILQVIHIIYVLTRMYWTIQSHTKEECSICTRKYPNQFKLISDFSYIQFYLMFLLLLPLLLSRMLLLLLLLSYSCTYSGISFH